MLRSTGMMAAGIGLVLAGCQKPEAPKEAATPPSAMAGAADATLGTAEIKDTAGKVLGTISLSQTNAGIAVSGRIVGLPPGDYGMHLHAVGLCEAPDFKSAGVHWNPTGKQHGVNNPEGPHEGDLPNLMILPDSTGMVQGVTHGGKFKSDSTALMDQDGAAVVIHARPDDYKTDPSGNSGARIACGVITAKP